MRIAIMGTGGVGGYYGGLLSKKGQEVIFIAREAHLQAMRAKSLHVNSVHGDFLVSPARATDNPAEVGPVDLILFATKTYHTDAVAPAIKPLIGKDTVVVPLQNGIDAAERIGAYVGREPLADRLKLAFIFGSLAQERETAQRDIDLFLVAELSLQETTKILGPTDLGREFNPVVYSPEEFKKKVRENRHFITEVIRGPKIWLIDNEEGLANLAE
jgi:ketopantoate reductase